VTARATSSCPTCHRNLVIDIDRGHLPDGPAPVLWLGRCGHVINEFCAHTNLFCNPEHLHTWRHATVGRTGEVVMLDEIPALARTALADIATHP
jgi:hypothetical protein